MIKFLGHLEKFRENENTNFRNFGYCDLWVSNEIPWNCDKMHSVEIWEFFPPQVFCKKSVKLTFSLKIYTVYRFDEKIFKWGKISEITTLHTVEFTKFLYHLKIISWNQLFSKLFTKEIVFTEIFQKVVIQKFRKIHSVNQLPQVKGRFSKNVKFGALNCPKFWQNNLKIKFLRKITHFGVFHWVSETQKWSFSLLKMQNYWKI